MLRDLSTRQTIAHRGAALALFNLDPDLADHHDAVWEVWDEDVYQLDSTPIAGRPVIDIGAHVGAFSVRAGLMGARVLALEPWPEAYSWLGHNLTANALLDAVVPLNVAAAPADGPPNVLIGPAGDTGMGTTAVAPLDEDAVTAPVLSPGAILERVLGLGLGDVDVALLKIDIEGGEHDLFGCPEMPRFLLPRCEKVILETHPGPALGRIVETLLPTHHVDVFGRPEAGGMLYANRY